MIRLRSTACLVLALGLGLVACQSSPLGPQASDPAMLQWGGPDRPPAMRAVLLDNHELPAVTAEYAATWTDIYHGPVLLHADGTLNPSPLDETQLQAFRDLCQPVGVRRRISVLVSPGFDDASPNPELTKSTAEGIAAFLRRHDYAGARLEWTTAATRENQRRLAFVDAVIQAVAGESREIELAVQPGDNLPPSLLSNPARLHLLPPPSTGWQIVTLAEIKANFTHRILQGADRKAIVVGLPISVLIDDHQVSNALDWLDKQNTAGHLVLTDE